MRFQTEGALFIPRQRVPTCSADMRHAPAVTPKWQPLYICDLWCHEQHHAVLGKQLGTITKHF